MSSATFGSVSINSVWLRKHGTLSSNSRQCDGSLLRVGASVASSPQSLQSTKEKIDASEKSVWIGFWVPVVILELRYGFLSCIIFLVIVRLLANHPHFDITTMTADRKAGRSIGSVFPHLMTQDLPAVVAIKDTDFSNIDAVFCCLPHGTTQEIIKGLPKQLKIVDLSVDFRLRNVNDLFIYCMKHQSYRKRSYMV